MTEKNPHQKEMIPIQRKAENQETIQTRTKAVKTNDKKKSSFDMIINIGCIKGKGKNS